MKISIDHINVLVEDWDKTVFYNEIFGFVEGKHVSGGRKNYLYTADHNRAIIHLSSMESKARSLADTSRPHQIQATPVSQNENTGALDHIAFNVYPIDFDKLFERLEARGQYRISETSPRQMWFFDPNGVKLEISDKI